MSRSISTRSLEAPVIADVDVVVAGGGSAGLAAAISSARTGARTALIERYGFFGGNAVSAYVGTICGLYYYEADDPAYVCRGFAREWAEGLVSAGAAFGPVPFKETAVLLYVPWMYKRLGDRLVRQEAGLVPLLHAPIVDAYLDAGGLRGVIIGSKRGPLAVLGKVFVDTTGDADLATFAGAQVELSPPGKRQFPSMQFLVENVDFEATRTAALERLSSPSGEPDAKAMSGAVTAHLSELLSTVGQEPRWNMGRSGGAVFPTFREGEVLGAMTRVTTDDGGPPDMTDPFEATAAEMDGRDEAERAHEFLKENLAGFEGSFLADTPTQLGVRETRRVAGEYVLSHEDVVGAARFDDSIGCGAWPEEFHWEGKGTEYVWLDAGVYYQMPYRMLLAAGVENLLVAGRCSSASPEALASTRVIAPSMVQGQAAGTAAAMAAAGGVRPKELDPVDLQKALTEAEAFLG